MQHQKVKKNCDPLLITLSSHIQSFNWTGPIPSLQTKWHVTCKLHRKKEYISWHLTKTVITRVIFEKVTLTFSCIIFGLILINIQHMNNILQSICKGVFVLYVITKMLYLLVAASFTCALALPTRKNNRHHQKPENTSIPLLLWSKVTTSIINMFEIYFTITIIRSSLKSYTGGTH
jgi:hypothetical protein